MKTLVSLVGDQTIPNVLFILEMQSLGQEVDHYLFVTTLRMEELQKTDCIIKAAGLNPLQCERIIVMEDSIDDVVQQLQRASHANHYLVNLTGGTKMMSVACYAWFSSRNSHIFYVPIGKNGWKQILPSGADRFTEFTTVLTLRQYWDACNIVGPADSEPLTLHRPADFTVQFFTRFVQLNLPSQTWQLLRDTVSMERPPADTVRIVQERLAQLGFQPTDPRLLSRDDVLYLTGRWFEEYVYWAATTWLHVPPAQTAHSVRLSRGMSRNEYDDLVLLDNTLHVMECKTSLANNTGVLSEASYKLAALRSEFGLQAKGHLFIADPTFDDSPDTFTSPWARARILGIRIAGPNTLLDRAKTLREFGVD
ncbi:MAG: Card1-like endonuclease domain-containing protein [Candidatus Cryosericum sp.]